MNKLRVKNKPTSLIIGGTGQDGILLSRLLLKKNYNVYCTTRAHPNNKINTDSFKIVQLNPEDFNQFEIILTGIKPDYIYMLSGQSSVGKSFKYAYETHKSFINPALNVLEVILKHNLNSKVFFPSSGDIFGDTKSITYADENSKRNPQSPYAVSKVCVDNIVKSFRKEHGIFACIGYLFNHESELRSKNFVTSKIFQSAQKISEGCKNKLLLGNLNIYRDWGLAEEYVVAFEKMLIDEKPNDYVIASGKSNSLENFVEIVFDYYDLDWKKHVEIDKSLFRQSDIEYSCGNPSLIRSNLNWKAADNLEIVIHNIINARKNLNNRPNF